MNIIESEWQRYRELFLSKSDAKIKAQIRQAFMSGAGATMANVGEATLQGDAEEFQTKLRNLAIDIEQEMRRYQTEFNPQRN